MAQGAKSILYKLYSAGRALFWACVWGVVCALSLMYPAHWLFGESLRPVRMAFYVTPWWLLVLVPGLLVAVGARRRWLALTAAVPTVLVLASILPPVLPKPAATPPPGGLSLKVLTYNTHGIGEIDGILEVIRRERADLVLIQEYAPGLAAPSFHGLDELYPYRDMVLSFGQAAFSRYPLQRLGVAYEQGKVQKLAVETPAGRITVWNVHPPPPFLVPPEQFDAQMKALEAAIRQTPGPLIVAGDFNATEQSRAYRGIERSLANAYREAGRGLGFTYPAPPYTFRNSRLQTGPLWRIDHIFHSRDWIATEARILRDSGGSDHFPVTATLYLAK